MKKNYTKVLLPLLALLFCGVIVIIERIGVIHSVMNKENITALSFSKHVEEEVSCLMLVNGKDKVSKEFQNMMETVLDGMKVSYDVLDVNKQMFIKELEHYDNVVVTFEDWNLIGDQLNELCEWVKNGGHMMNTVTPAPSEAFLAIAGILGIENIPDHYTSISGFKVLKDSMLGAKDQDVFVFDEENGEELLISLKVEVKKDTEVYKVSEDDQVPLMWKTEYGKGNFVVLNETLTEKYQRGFLCLAYSLLEPVMIYPVINASAYYLDDFPAPVPSGNGEYIRRDYGVDIGTFYDSVWWPKMLELEKKYKIKHTGLIIEQYSDVVNAPFVRNTDISKYNMYGNMLLNHGGELGFHGYNHMPLCLKGIDDERQYGMYHLWPSKKEMKKGLTELYSFSKELFPDLTFSVYVPPSNIISETGIRTLLEACPEIKVISSSYMKDAHGRVYEQEFTVDNTGLIHAPRITSGCTIDQYQKITALSELNFQYVQSHFTHPDDVLDEDRGASRGWEALSNDLEDYVKWIYESVPQIRNVTGSEMGIAVQQYHNISVKRQKKDNELEVTLGGYSGEAYLMLRINEGVPQKTEGCELTKLKGNLYMVKATKDKIKITLGE